MVQGLGLSAFTAKGPGSIPDQGSKILQAVQHSGKKKKKDLGTSLCILWASLVAQMVKNLPAMWETWVRSLVWEDSLEKGMTTTPVFWPGEFHGQRSLVGYSSRGSKE